MWQATGGSAANWDDDAVVLDEIDLRHLVAAGGPAPDESPLVIVGDPGARAILGELLNQYTPFLCTIEDGRLAEMATSAQDSAVRLALHGHAVEYWYAGVARSYRGIQANRLAGTAKDRWACTLDADRLSLGLVGRLFPNAHIVNVVPARRRDRREQRGLRLAGMTLPRHLYHEIAEEDLISRTEECLLRLLLAVGVVSD